MVTIFHIQEKENGKKYKLEVIRACILKDSNLWRRPQASHHNHSTLHVGDGNSETIPYILEKNRLGWSSSKHGADVQLTCGPWDN